MIIRSGTYTLRALLLITAGILVSVRPVAAQTPPPPIDEIEQAQQQMKVALDEYARQAADEYLEAIEQLQTILNDYGSYFARVDDATLRAYQISFEQFARGIDRGTYSENPEYLSEDITKFTANLQEQETKLKEGGDAKSKKLYVLVHNLRKDLTIVNDLIEKDIQKKLEVHKKLKSQIEQYLQLALAESQVRIRTIRQDRTEDSLMGNTGSQVLYIDTGGAFPKVVVVPEPLPVIPPIPGVPIVPSGKAGEVGLARKYADSIRVSRYATIYVTQPMGRTVVTGRGDNILSAELEVEVSAESRDIEKAFMSATTLRITAEKTGCFVETIFPKLTDPRTRIIRSTLTVELPSSNPVVCDNSFGDVSVGELGTGVTVKGRYSTINLDGIEGRVRVENSMGAITLSDITGPIDVLNSYAAVTMSDCNGDMSIQNENGPITLSDCNGRTRLVNSGPITVDDHSGDLEIENSNGQVTVANLAGNLRAFNSYRPMTISYVDGSVSLENTNAGIDASDISGAMDANNKFGYISVKSVRGPMTLTSQNGKITAVLDEQLNGLSSITSLSGVIDVSLPEDADLLVRAESQDGKINSSFPITVKTNNGMQLGEIKLGDGSTTLALKAKNTSINISETR